MLKVFVNEGDKFCRLTVLKEEVPIKQKNGRIKRMLKCQCDCGKVIVVPFHKVVSGKLKSCGCLVGDLGSERRKKYNTYETDGDVTKIYDAKGNYTLIDTENLEKVNADVAVCGFWYLYKNYEEKNEQLNMYQVMSQIDFLKNFLTDWTSGLIWNKIFCSDVVREIRFEEGHKIDDEFFTYKVIMKCKKIVMFDTPLYYYRMRASSVMSSSFKYQKQIILDRVEYITERFDLVTKAYPELREVYTENLTDNLIRLWRTSGEFPDIRSKLKRIIKKYMKLILTAKINMKLKYAFVCTILFERKKMPYKEIERKSVKKFFE